MVQLVHRTLKLRGENALVFYPFDSDGAGGLSEVSSHLGFLNREEYGCSAQVERVFFDEGNGGRSHEGCVANYSRPYAGRYGHSGIFHVVRVEVGHRRGGATPTRCVQRVGA